MTNKTGLLICVGLCLAMITKGQDLPDSTQHFNIQTKDGSRIRGSIVVTNTDYLKVRSQSLDEIKISKRQIKKITEFEASPINPSFSRTGDRTRNFFGPTAFTLDKGEMVYHNNLLFLNNLEVGLNKYLSVELGPDLFTILNYGAAAAFAKVKLGMELKKNIRVAGGFMVHLDTYDLNIFESSAYTLAFGAVTYGNEDRNITGAFAYGIIDYNSIEFPVLSLSGQWRLSERVALVSENWRIPFDYVYGFYPDPDFTRSICIFTAGTRLLFNNLSVDLAIGAEKQRYGLYPFPYLGAAYRFAGNGKKYRYLYE